MRTTTVIIGAGQAGLAMSRCLAERSIDHVVLERGEVANSWRTERWDSLRLLTPNWQSRLPGFAYTGEDPDGYRSMPQTVDFLQAYAQTISAPVETRTTVKAVRARGHGYVVETDRGDWRCRSVVLASGACNVPSVPAVSEALPAGIDQLTPINYRNPDQLKSGGVLVVGASASGVQIAHELQASGRQVTLAVGEHIRVPRVYRGRDIKTWMDATGVLDERYDEVDDLNRVRNLPSLQLAGRRDGSMLDLNSLTDAGVRLTGRFVGVNQGKAQFSGSLRNHCAMADLKMNRLLNAIDEWILANELDSDVQASHRFDATSVPDSPPLAIDATRGEIETVLWATGYRPDYSWLELPVFDRKGRLRHDGGVVDAPGLYVLGLPFLRRRKSTLIDGAGDDARELSRHLADYLSGRQAGPLLGGLASKTPAFGALAPA